MPNYKKPRLRHDYTFTNEEVAIALVEFTKKAGIPVPDGEIIVDGLHCKQGGLALRIYEAND